MQKASKSNDRTTAGRSATRSCGRFSHGEHPFEYECSAFEMA